MSPIFFVCHRVATHQITAFLNVDEGYRDVWWLIRNARLSRMMHGSILSDLCLQVYMNLVTLSVIFLLWSNNPPESLLKKGDVAAPTTPSGASGCIERDTGNPNDSSDAEEAKVSNGRRRRSSAVVQ